MPRSAWLSAPSTSATRASAAASARTSGRTLRETTLHTAPTRRKSATATGVENPLVNNFVKNCAEAWYHWACDQRIVDLNRQWALETDPARRKQITDELQRVHLENVTLVPLGMYRPTIIYRKELTDLIPAPAIFYWNIKKRGGA